MSQIQKLPSNIGDHYLELHQYNKDTVQYIPLSLPATSSDPLTIGRSSDNTIQILNNTVSKNHAQIVTAKNRLYLIDLNSVNGTFLNGSNIKQKTQSQAILNNGDSIQFGKYESIYIYRDRNKVVRTKSRGKINLKDYMFEEKNNEQREEVNMSPEKQKSDLSIESKVRNKKRGKSKVKEGRIKIPDIADYLQLQPEGNLKEGEKEIEKEKLKENQKKRQKESKGNNKKEGKVKLGQISDYLTMEEKKNIQLYQKEKNIFMIEEEKKKDIEEKERRIEEQKLKMQIQKVKYSEDLLQKQLILEDKLKQEQAQIEEERRKLEDEFIKREELKREEEMKKIRQLEEKEKLIMQKLDEERQKQVEEIKKKEEQYKLESENQYRNEYEKRKKELEVEAEALARQYENIYRETIKKVRNQIDYQQNDIQKMEIQISQALKSNEQIDLHREKLVPHLNKLKKELILLCGRNKASVLYASQVQNKIDQIKEERKHQSEGYYQSRQKGSTKKLKQSIVNSRKLLKVKQKQYQSLWSQIVGVKGCLNDLGSYSDVSEYIETIFQNTNSIQKLKQEYLECVEGEKGIQEMWSAALEENHELDEKNRLYQNEIKKNSQEIDENTRDQIKKGTEQRLHMLKIIFMCSEEKKNAAKFLIEEMLQIEQQIHKYIIENESIHKQIVQLITKTEKIKRNNEYLSEILFGQDEYGHHFDNMKFVINNLIEKIQVEKEQSSVQNCLKIKNQGAKLELKLYQEGERRKKIKENMRKINQLGIAPVQIKSNEKNPLIFFGDLLTNRQIEIDSKNVSIKKLENEIHNEEEEIALLEERKRKISLNLQRFKSQELKNARLYLKQ